MIELKLSGRVSSENAEQIDKQFFEIIGDAVKPEIHIDANELEYISSAGLRVLMKLSKMAKSVTVSGVNSEVMEIFEVTGFSSFLNIQRKMKEMSVDGLKVIGEGVTAVVYRIDDEKILKLYREGYSEAEIREEQATTKNAFVMGIPTMISYDIVKVGNQFGAVYEAFNFSTLESEYVKASEAERKQMTVKHAALAKEMSSIIVESDDFVDFKENIKKQLEVKKPSLSEEKYNVFKSLIDKIPDDRHFIHGDCHMGNIMIGDGGAYYVIDLGICGYGNLVFVLHTLCLYNLFAGIFPVDAYKAKTKLTPDEGRICWDNFMRAYFSDKSDDVLEKIKNCEHTYCCIFSILNYDFIPDEVVKMLSDEVVERSKKEDYDLFFKEIKA